MKQGPKPPIHREHVFGDPGDPGHRNVDKLNGGDMESRPHNHSTLKGAVRAIPKT